MLHTDRSVLPRRERAWASWNYERAADGDREQARVCLHYLLNRLQPLPWQQPVLVSLNPVREPDAKQVHAEFDSNAKSGKPFMTLFRALRLRLSIALTETRQIKPLLILSELHYAKNPVPRSTKMKK